jgi:hypothetical protein
MKISIKIYKNLMGIKLLNSKNFDYCFQYSNVKLKIHKFRLALSHGFQ